ncbi:MAG: hypothetical protein LBU70_01640 [Chitinispirillales bacterium]|nr:hypothetical protein [Chitinispirillales bacterium]
MKIKTVKKRTMAIGFAIVFTVLAFLLAGCQKERAHIEIDFSGAAGWKYRISANITGIPAKDSSEERHSGSLMAFLQGLPTETVGEQFRAGLADVNLNAPFMPEDEREEILRRLSKLVVSVSDDGVALSDTVGIPGVYSGAWDILRSPARAIPAIPNAVMSVGSSWEREQRFPIAVAGGEAEGYLYQFYTLDSLYKNTDGVSAADISWMFTYRVAMAEDGDRRSLRFPLDGSGHGSAVIDLDRKKLIKSQASFQITHSGLGDADINEIIHFEAVE